jgi:hypothetical protein
LTCLDHYKLSETVSPHEDHQYTVLSLKKYRYSGIAFPKYSNIINAKKSEGSIKVQQAFKTKEMELKTIETMDADRHAIP